MKKAELEKKIEGCRDKIVELKDSKFRLERDIKEIKEEKERIQRNLEEVEDTNKDMRHLIQTIQTILIGSSSKTSKAEVITDLFEPHISLLKKEREEELKNPRPYIRDTHIF